MWTRLIQHLIAKMYIMLWKLIACFSEKFARIRMYFILQKNLSTILRIGIVRVNWLCASISRGLAFSDENPIPLFQQLTGNHPSHRDTL